LPFNFFLRKARENTCSKEVRRQSVGVPNIGHHKEKRCEGCQFREERRWGEEFMVQRRHTRAWKQEKSPYKIVEKGGGSASMVEELNLWTKRKCQVGSYKI